MVTKIMNFKEKYKMNEIFVTLVCFFAGSVLLGLLTFVRV